MIGIRGAVQRYAWGKVGRESLVAKFALASGSLSAIDLESPYAELWLGTHPKAPAQLEEDNENGATATDLLSLISQRPSLLGEKLRNEFGDRLPFLFKVLSIGNTLSIQAHPDKKLAESLHQSDPDHYPDDNHKPELMCVLSSKFEMLSSFRKLEDIIADINENPSILSLLHDECKETFAVGFLRDNVDRKKFLKSIYCSIMNANSQDVSQCLSSLSTSIRRRSHSQQHVSRAQKLFLRLLNLYPSDGGCLSCFLLNYVECKTGDCVYIAAGEPHAYISGDCIECMSCSDNVVRGGLTPKFVDLPVLVNMLTYTDGPPIISNGEVLAGYPEVTVYQFPIREFALFRIEISGSTTEWKFPKNPSCGIVFCVEGSCELVSCNEESKSKFQETKAGNAVFLAGETEIMLKTAQKAGCILYACYANIS